MPGAMDSVQGQTKTTALHAGALDSVQGQTKTKDLHARGTGQRPKSAKD